MITTSAIFDHRGRSKKGDGPVEIRIIYERKPHYINTGIRVKKSEFQFGQVVNRNDAKELNERLSIITKKIADIVNRSISENVPIDVAAIKSEVWRLHDGRKPFTEWAEEQVLGMDFADGTLKHYYTLLRRIREYGRLSQWNELTPSGIVKFDEWLHCLISQDGKGRISDASLYNYHKCLKALLSRAVSFGVMQRNPYELLRGRFKRGEKQTVQYLTESEMDAFVSLRPVEGSAMDVAHDLFIFQMFTGLSYSDAQAFDLSDYRLTDGKWMHVGERIKTGVPYVSVLLQPAVDVLEKYGWRVPRIDNADYNHALKLLGAAAGIRTPLHSHMARHTFATWMLKNGVRIENVSRMLGHTNITMTQRYARVLAESVRDDFERVGSLLDKKK